MTKLMELIDAYAQAAVDVDTGLYQGTASNYTQRLEAHDKARTAVVEAVEKLERDAERYVWLLANMGTVEQHSLKWQPARDKPLLSFLQDFIDEGIASPEHGGQQWLLAQRKLLEATNGQGN